jgi:murein L,D-transpeptidase YcbB/YkuD
MASAAAAPPLAAGDGLRQRLQGVGAPLRVEAAAESLYNVSALVNFYDRHAYQPVWILGSFLRPAAKELLAAIAAAAAEGLEPGNYHSAALDTLCRRFVLLPTDGLATDLELLLTDAFFQLAADYRYGSTAPDGSAARDPREFARLLDQALAGGQVQPLLRSLLPLYPDYAALRSAWQRYRQIGESGDWPRIPAGGTLRRGSQGRGVAALRQRLASEGDLPPEASGGELFDAALEKAVRRFQRRHGLPVNGVVGSKTRTALNVPATARAAQLALNLERRRWLPREFPTSSILVNIPGFSLQLWERGRVALTMRVIVGRLARQTPNFSSNIIAVVFNPQWDVPRSIAVEDLLPRIQNDVTFLTRRGFHVYTAGRRDEEELDPTTIDWQGLGKKNFSYHLVQEPGPYNALGRLKFIVPNGDYIYLHDTPSRALFSAATPAYSSGCIRLEEPQELAVRLLADTPYGNAADLAVALDEGGSRVVPLAQPRPIHIVYWTAWVDTDGLVQFRSDLYQRDQSLAEKF